MAYSTGTINNANPGPTLYADLATALGGVTGWSLSDTVVISSRTHKIWKSAAANNTYGLDWYLDISYPTTGAGLLLLAPFEGFNTSTDLGLRGPFSQNTTTLDGTTYSRYGATDSALETNWANSATYTSLGLSLPATSFGYWLNVTPNRVILLTSISPSTILYTGFFAANSRHQAHAGGALFPLVMVNLQVTNATSSATAGSVSAAVTRVPKLSAVNWGSGSVNVEAGTTGISYLTEGVLNVAASEVTGQVAGVPAHVKFTSATAGIGSAGELMDVLVANSTGVTRGDTVTIGSDTWVAGTTASNKSLLMKAV